MFAGRIEFCSSLVSGNGSDLVRSCDENNNSYKRGDTDIHTLQLCIKKEKEENIMTMYFKRFICRKQLALQLMLPIESLNTWLATKIQEDVKNLSFQLENIKINNSMRLDAKDCSANVDQSLIFAENNDGSSLQDWNLRTPQKYSNPFSLKEERSEEFKIEDHCTEVEENTIALYHQRVITEHELAKLCNVSIISLDKWLMKKLEKDVKKLRVKFKEIMLDPTVSSKIESSASELPEAVRFKSSRSSFFKTNSNDKKRSVHVVSIQQKKKKKMESGFITVVLFQESSWLCC